MLRITNLGAANCNFNQTGRKNSTTCDKVCVRPTLPLWRHLPTTALIVRPYSIMILAWVLRHCFILQTNTWSCKHWHSTNLLPSTINNNRRETRSSDTDHLKFSTNRCKTTTYQRSYLNRTTRLWNILPEELTGINISITQFKSGLYKYYQLAVKNVFDVDDPRTWKSICLSCNKCRNLSCEISCCY